MLVRRALYRPTSVLLVVWVLQSLVCCSALRDRLCDDHRCWERAAGAVFYDASKPPVVDRDANVLRFRGHFNFTLLVSQDTLVDVWIVGGGGDLQLLGPSLVFDAAAGGQLGCY